MEKPWDFEAPLCREVGTESFYPELEDGNKNDMSHERIANAKRICRMCEHRTACAEWAIHNEVHGIWGGMTPMDRRRVRRRRRIRLSGEEVA